MQHVIDLCYHVAKHLPGTDRVLAANLLVGTAYIESKFVYRRQLGGGPAKGLWQMEPNTAKWLAREYLQSRLDLAQTVTLILSSSFPVCREDLFGAVNTDRLMFGIEHNDLLACVFARLKYLSIPDAIPDTIKGLAKYWKMYYNGAGDNGLQEEDFVEGWYELFGHGTDVKESLI